MPIEVGELPPVSSPEELLKLIDSYASTNYFDGCGGNPIHGARSQAQRAEVKEKLWRVYEEVDHLRLAARDEAHFADEQKAIAEEQGNKVIEIKNAMNVVVEECRGLKEMSDLLAMNSDYLMARLEAAFEALECGDVQGAQVILYHATLKEKK